MKQVNISSTNMILFLVLTHMWNKHDLQQRPSPGNFCWPLCLQGSPVKMSVWWCWVSWFHWAVSLLILPFFFSQEKIQNLGLWGVDFGLLENIRHLIWIHFRSSKTQEPKGPALSPGSLSSSWSFCSCFAVQFAAAHTIPSVAQVNCSWGYVVSWFDPSQQLSTTQPPHPSRNQDTWWTKQWNNLHLGFPLAPLFSTPMNSPMQCSVQPY